MIILFILGGMVAGCAGYILGKDAGYEGGYMDGMIAKIEKIERIKFKPKND